LPQGKALVEREFFRNLLPGKDDSKIKNIKDIKWEKL